MREGVFLPPTRHTQHRGRQFANHFHDARLHTGEKIDIASRDYPMCSARKGGMVRFIHQVSSFGRTGLAATCKGSIIATIGKNP
jgi:hypothetical protein